MLYVCVRGVMDVVFCLYCNARSCRCSCMGSMSVMSCMYVCLCLVCILWQFSMLHSALLMLVEDARGDHMEETYSRVGLMTAL